MKKLMYLFVAAMFFVFTACGGGETATEEVAPAVEEVVEVEAEVAEEVDHQDLDHDVRIRAHLEVRVQEPRNGSPPVRRAALVGGRIEIPEECRREDHQRTREDDRHHACLIDSQR